MIKLKLLLNELEYPLAKGEDLQSYEGMEGWKGKLVWMSPDKFLRLCYPLPSYCRSEESLDNLRYRMKNGLPLDFLLLAIDVAKRKVTGHEGRHRATIAKELGIEQVPVLIYTGNLFKRVPEWSPEDHEMADKAEFKPEWDNSTLNERLTLQNFDAKIEKLEKEWERVDHMGGQEIYQQELSSKISKLQREKEKWEKLYKTAL